MGSAAKIRRRARKRDIRDDLADYTPIVISDTADGDDDQEPEEVEEIHLFTVRVDGELKEFYAPTRVDFTYAVQSMDVAATQGEAAAIRYQFVALVGEEGYRALITAPGLTRSDFLKIAAVANKIVMSSMEGKAQ